MHTELWKSQAGVKTQPLLCGEYISSKLVVTTPYQVYNSTQLAGSDAADVTRSSDSKHPTDAHAG